MNRFLDCEGYYYPKEVWVATSGTYGGSTDPLDWTVYPYTGELNITTNAAEVTDGVIYVEKGYVIRFVADLTEKNVDVSAVFYDYDISNGEIYASLDDAKTHTNGIATSEQDGSMVSKKVYTDTRKAGINSDDNYGDLSKGRKLKASVLGLRSRCMAHCPRRGTRLSTHWKTMESNPGKLTRCV